MGNMHLHAKRSLLIAAVCVFACTTTGCLESSFDLANESRLPNGMTIPFGLTRSEVSVTVDFWTLGEVTFTVRDKLGKKLVTVNGKTKGNPVYLKSTPQRPVPRYPEYQLIIINGASEIMEQKRADSILYITDDPDVRKEVLADKRML